MECEKDPRHTALDVRYRAVKIGVFASFDGFPFGVIRTDGKALLDLMYNLPLGGVEVSVGRNDRMPEKSQCPTGHCE